MFVGIVLRDFDDYKYVKNSLLKALNEFDLVPLFLTSENIKKLIHKCSGFILPGGDIFSDIEEEVIEYAIENDKPLLGICLGMQALACFSIKENELLDLTKENNTEINHLSKEKYVHKVLIEKNSLLYKILKKRKIKVNSRHKTHIEKVNFDISAKSTDNIIESIEIKDKKFIIGVQWHPEDMMFYDKSQFKLIKYFIDMCKRN